MITGKLKVNERERRRTGLVNQLVWFLSPISTLEYIEPKINRTCIRMRTSSTVVHSVYLPLPVPRSGTMMAWCLLLTLASVVATARADTRSNVLFLVSGQS